MAGIDHTIIPFHNGRLMREVIKRDGDEYVSLIPFEYTRDGEILGVTFDKVIQPSLCCSDNRLAEWVVNKLGKYLHRETLRFYQKDDLEIFLYQCHEYNVTFYIHGDESYVLLGGYGHYLNPYTHFFHRGYGEEFERKMAKECYKWLCSDVLTDLLAYTDSADQDAVRERHKEIRRKLRFKKYWDMTPEEREAYNSQPMMDYDEEGGNTKWIKNI